MEIGKQFSIGKKQSCTVFPLSLLYAPYSALCSLAGTLDIYILFTLLIQTSVQYSHGVFLSGLLQLWTLISPCSQTFSYFALFIIFSEIFCNVKNVIFDCRKGIQLAHVGNCTALDENESCADSCPEDEDTPVCGSDGNSYR